MHTDLTEIAVIAHRLSSERLGPYVVAGGGDTAAGLDLYVWNAELSAALATTLGHVEVVLRNAIHENLTTWSIQRFGEPRWYRNPGHLLHPRHAEAIRIAQQRVRQNGRRAETPGRIVGNSRWDSGGICWPAITTRRSGGRPFTRSSPGSAGVGSFTTRSKCCICRAIGSRITSPCSIGRSPTSSSPHCN